MTNDYMAVEIANEVEKAMLSEGANSVYAKSCALLAQKAAINMAEWKDKNPSIETIKTIMCYALKNTNIMLAEDLENDVNWETLTKAALAFR